MINGSSEKSRDTRYKTIIILLVVLAALSNVSKDLQQVEEFVSSLQVFAEDWLGQGLMTASAKTLGDSCATDLNQESISGNEFRWKGRIASGGTVEIKGINGDIRAEATNSNEVEVVARKQGLRSDPETVRIEVIDQGKRVTICAIYPSTGATQSNTCEPDLPATISTEVIADTFNGEVSTDFPITVLGNSNRKHLDGTIGAGGRKLILKTLNGSINLRRAS